MPPRIPTSLPSRQSVTLLIPTTRPSKNHLLPAALTSQPFSTTAPVHEGNSRKKLKKLQSAAPPYPYPIKHTYKQSHFGLYASKHIQFGNNRPEAGLTVTLRTWRPNIKVKKLWSFGLGEWVRCKLVTNVLRTIDKVGGLDNYLLSEKPARLKELGPWGWELRYRLQTSKTVQRKYQEDRVKMGLITEKKKLAENIKMGVNRGLQVERVKDTYKKVKTPSMKDRVVPFAKRWEMSTKTDKVLPGESWRSIEVRRRMRAADRIEKSMARLKVLRRADKTGVSKMLIRRREARNEKLAAKKAAREASGTEKAGATFVPKEAADEIEAALQNSWASAAPEATSPPNKITL